MKSDSSTNETTEDLTYNKLVESPLYQTYRKAFHDATGMNLVLIPASEDVLVAPGERRYLNPFCQKINGEGTACSNCSKANRCILSQDNERAETITCFAGMRETAIPIRSGGLTIAYLRTGQVFTEPPREEDFDEIAKAILKQNSKVTNMTSLRKAWAGSRVMPVEQYQGIITLLAAFAVQLSGVLNRLVIEDANREPDTVSKAKQFVSANLEDKVCLLEVARRVGVSSFYFCKIFKKSTGMTLTEYVNRRRVEWAMQKLANPRARVTEVAYDVGYQSLSQFNRSFLRYAGMSPTRYREAQCSRHVMDRGLAA